MHNIKRLILITLTLPMWAFAQTKVDTVSFDDVNVSFGDMAPDFSASDETGTIRTLSHLKNKKNLVLIFYRGYW